MASFGRTAAFWTTKLTHYLSHTVPSQQTIKKHILRAALKKGVTEGTLVQVKASYKLSAEAKKPAPKPKAKKAAAPKKEKKSVAPKEKKAVTKKVKRRKNLCVGRLGCPFDVVLTFILLCATYRPSPRRR
jgi:linker histone H1 and H5 family